MPRDPDGPRSPDDQEWTGTGTPRSADVRLPDRAVEAGRDTTSQPASAHDVRINRSRSGGSGGAFTGATEQEGSGGASMSELLAGKEEEEEERVDR